MKACGNDADYDNFDFTVKEIIEPEKLLVEKYNEKYEKYSSLYPALKSVFSKL